MVVTVHKKCKEMIEVLNQKGQVKFSDMTKLKSFGKDAYSKMKKEQLLSILSPDIYKFLLQKCEADDILLSAMRWVARGLNPSLALYKMEVDKEINENRKTANTTQV